MDDDDIDYLGLIQCLHWNLSVQWFDSVFTLEPFSTVVNRNQ
jgi:hypothetical protein